MNDYGYPYIAKSGRYTGSSAAFIEQQCERAKSSGAPKDAIHWDLANKRWATTDDLINGSLRTFMGLPDLPDNHPTMMAYYGRMMYDAFQKLEHWSGKMGSALALGEWTPVAES